MRLCVEAKWMRFTIRILLPTIILFGILVAKLPNVREWALVNGIIDVVEEEQEKPIEDIKVLETNNDEVENEAQHTKLRITLSKEVSPEHVEISNHYLTQTVRIVIPHTEDNYFENHPIVGSSNHIAGVDYTERSTGDMIEITMDQVYELDLEYDGEYLYLDFIEPSALYDKVIVVDAGHGGADSGAEREGIHEKDINLAILLELQKLLDASEKNIRVYYTRTEDVNPSHEQRVQMANNAKADLFISIHCNSYEDRHAPSIYGTEVMYNDSKEVGEASKKLAQICMEELTQKLGSRDRGILNGDSIYIINRSKVPVALVEVGFMTHKEERNLLNSKEYQIKAAEGIYAAICRALEEGF